MKQYYILFCTLAIVIGLNIFQCSYLTNTGEKLKEEIEVIQKSIEQKNYSEISNKISGLENNWEKCKSLWDILTEHDDVEQIESSIASLKAFTKIEEQGESLNECYILKQRIDHILENERVNLSNIF